MINKEKLGIIRDLETIKEYLILMTLLLCFSLMNSYGELFFYYQFLIYMIQDLEMKIK
jgi:hypothetical protein